MDAAGPITEVNPVNSVDLANHPSGIVPQLQNVVATVNLDCQLDLKKIASQARNAEYNPKRFAAVIMRIREPKTTALIFASGKMVCTGAKSEQESRLAARRYAKIIQKLGFPAMFKEFKIQNIVGSCDVKFPIRLEGLAYAHGLFSSYEPELFPGLIYRMKDPKIVLLVFVSGKVVLTGAKKRDEIYEAFEQIYPTLQEFRKGDAAAPVATPSTSGRDNQEEGAGAGQAMRPPPPRTGMPPPTPRDLPPPTPAYNLPPPTPQHSLPPPTPYLPPPTPMHSGLPPPTPRHTPMIESHSLPPPTPRHTPMIESHSLPPPTPRHTPAMDGPSIPPPTPHHPSIESTHSLPPPTPRHEPVMDA